MITQAKQEHPEASVRRLCQIFGVNRSWYLQQRVPASAASLEEDTKLRDAVERLCLAFPGYGYRRVTAQLHRDGWTINHKRVLKIMQDESLLCRLQRAFRPPSPGSTKVAYPNLTQGLLVTKLDQLWVVDITPIKPHLYSSTAGLRVSSLRAGRFEPPLHRLVLVQRHRHAPDACRLERGDCGPVPVGRLDPSFGPGRSVRKRRVPCPFAGDRSLPQYE